MSFHNGHCLSRARPRCPTHLAFLSVFVVCCWAPLVGAAETKATLGREAQDLSLPPPFSFAPSPFVFPDPNNQAKVEKRLQTLLKSFSFIQQAKVILSPTQEGPLRAHIIVQLRARQPLTIPALQALLAALVEATPELSPQGLNILTPQGQILVRQGQIQMLAAPTLAPSAYWSWMSGLIVVGGGLGLVGFLWWRRKKGVPKASVDNMILDYKYKLIQELRQERPEICGVLIAAASPRAARWLRRECQKAEVPYVLPTQPVAPTIVALISQTLQERLKNQ